MSAKILYKLPPQMVRNIDEPLDNYVNGMQVKHGSHDVVVHVQR